GRAAGTEGGGRGVMMHSTVKTLESFDGRERVLISRRPDGTYTYRRQWLSVATPNDDPDSAIADASEGRDGAWGPPGPDCGIYDSADTAETEARQRVPWLRQQFNWARVGWVERSETHHLAPRRERWVSLRSTHPTHRQFVSQSGGYWSQAK